MKFLKWLALGLLNLILFLSISSLGLSYMINETVMRPAFTVAEINKLDITAIVAPLIQAPQLPPEVRAYITPDMLNAAITPAMKSSEPALKEELQSGVYRSYDYLFGRSRNLKIEMSLEPFKRNLHDALWASLQQNPPSQINGVAYASIPKATVEQYFNQQFDQFAQQIPPSFLVIDISQFDAQTISALRDVQRYIGYYDFGWRLLIPLIFVCIAAIIFIENDLRGSLRNLGINLLIYGAFGVIGDLLIDRFFFSSFSFPGLPESVNIWLVQLIEDIAWPLTVFSIAVAVVGVLLIGGSFLIKKKVVLPEPVRVQVQ